MLGQALQFDYDERRGGHKYIYR